MASSRIARIEGILRVIGADAADPERVRRAEASVARLRTQLAEVQAGEASLAEQVPACLPFPSPPAAVLPLDLPLSFALCSLVKYTSSKRDDSTHLLSAFCLILGSEGSAVRPRSDLAGSKGKHEDQGYVL